MIVNKPQFIRGARVKSASPSPSATAKPTTKHTAVAPPTVEPATPSKRAQRREREAQRDEWYRQRQAEVSRERFWIIWAPEARRPSMRHATAQHAHNAVERLRLKYPDVEFLVYECVLVRGDR